MTEIVVSGKVLQWGNSYGIRLTKAEVDQAGLHAGQDVQVKVLAKDGKIDLSGFPVFDSGVTDTSMRHDEILAQGRYKDLQERGRDFARWEARKRAARGRQ